MASSGQALLVGNNGVSLQVSDIPVSSIVGGTNGQTLTTNNLGHPVWSSLKWSWALYGVNFSPSNQNVGGQSFVTIQTGASPVIRFGSNGVGGISASPITRNDATNFTVNYTGTYRIWSDSIQLDNNDNHGGQNVTLQVWLSNPARVAGLQSNNMVANNFIMFYATTQVDLVAGQTFIIRAITTGIGNALINGNLYFELISHTQ